ncbi:MAG: hotdog fold thioesterase [Chitinophagales bacterium]
MIEPIWFKKDLRIDDFKHWLDNTMAEALNMEFTGIGPDYLCAKMPVTNASRQPYGFLHGGASVALAETMGSLCSALTVDPEKQISLGIEINANHVRTIREGYVYGRCSPYTLGATIQIWNIEIRDEQDRLICISRHTVIIRKKA